MKEIQGVITHLDGSTVIIRSSSGASYTITTPTDVITAYNITKASQYYNNQTVKEGGNLSILYAEEDQHNKTITSNKLITVRLQIAVIGKSDPAASY
jgi:hypothetical protein